jgi:hypothetical protein
MTQTGIDGARRRLGYCLTHLTIMLKHRLPAHHGHDENPPKLTRNPTSSRLLVFVKS